MTGAQQTAWIEAGAPAGVLAQVRLARYTTFGIGGPADWFFDAVTTDDVVRVIRAARSLHVPVTLLGGGSNVLVSDAGVRGLVVRLRTTTIESVAAGAVRADAGVTINGLVRWLIRRGLGGLEAWAGTPGTVGGAVCGNAHFGGRLIGEFVRDVRLLTADGNVLDVPASEMAFGYDASRLHASEDVLLSAGFAIQDGQDVERLRATARASLLHRKQTQPLHLPSAGCAFQNPDPDTDTLPVGCPASAGALIDRVGLKGVRVGGAMVSPVHANFIVNEGHATAADVRALIECCRQHVYRQFGVRLRDEIVCMGEF